MSPRAEPEPRAPRGTLGRGCALRPGSSLPGAFSGHRWCNLPGRVPAPPRSFLGWTDLLAPTPARSGRGDLYSQGGGRAGAAAARSGGRAGRRRAALPAQVGRGGADSRRGREWRGGRGGGGTRASPRAAAVAAAAFKPSAPPPPPGPGAGGGAGEERRPGRLSAPPPAGRRANAAQVRAGCRTCRAPRCPHHLGRGWAKVQWRHEKREEKKLGS